jgi:uncharacterized protein YbbC (DUF1343 family)
MRLSFFTLFYIVYFSCWAQEIIPGAERGDVYLSKLKSKNIAVACNHTSVVGDLHLIDYLLTKKIRIDKIFAPEHGFRGEADAGAYLKSEVDQKTGIAIKSLYGKNFKPSSQDLKGIDLVVFDIQDVGVRFYTYISTLQYILEACGEADIPVLILDRPNPNGHYVDGPVLEAKHKSFVGMQPIPVVYGMTIGEYAQMLVGEKWLQMKSYPKIDIVKCLNYSHTSKVHVKIPPSPNLKTDQAIRLYPSLCLFEGTDISVGRGTETPFELFGSPRLDAKFLKDTFTPIPRKGATAPFLVNQLCYGQKLHNYEMESKFNISFVLQAYKFYLDEKKNFFLPSFFFDNLAGNSTLRWQIINGKSEQDIRASWSKDLEKFKKIRKRYLLYSDFENK